MDLVFLIVGTRMAVIYVMSRVTSRGGWTPNMSRILVEWPASIVSERTIHLACTNSLVIYFSTITEVFFKKLFIYLFIYF